MVVVPQSAIRGCTVVRLTVAPPPSGRPSASLLLRRLQLFIGIAHVENKASIKVLEKVGFRFETLKTYQSQPVAWYDMERAACPLLSE